MYSSSMFDYSEFNGFSGSPDYIEDGSGKNFLVVNMESVPIHKILVISDSHGKNDNMYKAMKNLDGYMDLMIHLGDIECNEDLILSDISCPLILVKGNCDTASYYPKQVILKTAGHRMLITHGREYSGEYSLEEMRTTARTNDVDVMMCGHTHVPLVDIGEDVTIVNPGSISKPRQYGHKPTYLVMNIDNNGDIEYVPVIME